VDGVEASGTVSKQVIQQLQALKEVAQDLRRRRQGVMSLATSLEQSQQHLPSPVQVRQSLNNLQHPLAQASAKVASPDTTKQLRELSCRLQQMAETMNQAAHRWGSPAPQVPSGPSVEAVPPSKPPLCQD